MREVDRGSSLRTSRRRSTSLTAGLIRGRPDVDKQVRAPEMTDRQESRTLDALALVSLVSSILLSIYVLLPKSGFVFGLNAPRMYESLFEVADDEREIRRRLIYWLEGYWQSNQAKIETLGRYYFGAAITLLLQLLFWAWALADTIS